jgi:hypothetical protein
MPVASIVVETLPGAARTVAERMGHLQGMGSLSADGDHRILAVWRVRDGDTLEGLSEALHAMNPEIVEVFPSLLAEED